MTDGEFDPKFSDKPQNEVTVGLHEFFAAGDRENSLLQEAKMELLEKCPQYEGLHVIHRNDPNEKFAYKHTYDAFIQIQCKGHIYNIRDLKDATDEQIRKGYRMSLHEAAHRIFTLVETTAHKFNIKRYTTELWSHALGERKVKKPVTVYVNYTLPEGSIVVSPDVEMHLNVNINPGNPICIPFLRYERD